MSNLYHNLLASIWHMHEEYGNKIGHRPNLMLLFGIKAMLLIGVLLVQTTALSQEYTEYEMINITAGQVGIFDDINGPQRYGLEYRFKSFAGPSGFRLIPAIGLAAAKNGAYFIYTDLRHDFYMNDHWILIPSFGLGTFHDSSEIDLGNELEFRSGIEVAYQFTNNIRAGLALFHISNGGISSHNPGTEILVFSVCIPVELYMNN